MEGRIAVSYEESRSDSVGSFDQTSVRDIWKTDQDSWLEYFQNTTKQ